MLFRPLTVSLLQPRQEDRINRSCPCLKYFSLQWENFSEEMTCELTHKEG